MYMPVNYYYIIKVQYDLLWLAINYLQLNDCLPATVLHINSRINYDLQNNESFKSLVR